MYNYSNIKPDYSNIKFEALEDKGMSIRGEIKNPWAKKGDIFVCIGTAYQLNHWTENDEADSHVWQNQRTNKIEYDERIWNNNLKMIKNNE